MSDTPQTSLAPKAIQGLDVTEFDRILAERASELAVPLDEAQRNLGDELGTEGTVPYLCFLVGTTRFATPLVKARRIVKSGEPTRVPAAPRILPRLVQVDGRIVSVVDLGALFNLEGAHGREPAHIVLLEADGSLLGVGVDRLEGLRMISGDAIAEKTGSAQTERFVIGTGPELTVILDADALVRGLRAERRAGTERRTG